MCYNDNKISIGIKFKNFNFKNELFFENEKSKVNVNYKKVRRK